MANTVMFVPDKVAGTTLSCAGYETKIEKDEDGNRVVSIPDTQISEMMGHGLHTDLDAMLENQENEQIEEAKKSPKKRRLNLKNRK